MRKSEINEIVQAVLVAMEAQEKANARPKGKKSKKGKAKAKPVVLSRTTLRELKASGKVPYGLTKTEAAEFLGKGYTAPSGKVRKNIRKANKRAGR